MKLFVKRRQLRAGLQTLYFLLAIYGVIVFVGIVLGTILKI